MADESSTSAPSAETEAAMTPTTLELLFPPFACLACIALGLILWTLIFRLKSKNTRVSTSNIIDANLPLSSLQKNSFSNQTKNKISPSQDKTSNTAIFTLGLNNTEPTDPLTISPLFEQTDLPLIDMARGGGAIKMRELFYILLPVIFSLGFCPVTFLLHVPMVKFLWPPDMYETPPNINDAIACYLVPAGMVYAISFGFAFQQVAGGFVETEALVDKQTDWLMKLVTFIKDLKVVSTATRLTMMRIIKDMTLTSLSRLTGHNGESTVDFSDDVEHLLRLLYAGTIKDNTNGKDGANVKGIPDVKDTDPWQRSLYQRLEKMLKEADGSLTKLSKTRIHALQWAFLESLGYFTLLGMLLVQCSSYRAQLAMCLITVISISLLSYVVADLDSPFHGFFQIPLRGFSSVIERLHQQFNRAAGDLMLEASFTDI